jgi:hypothetical protein
VAVVVGHHRNLLQARGVAEGFDEAAAFAGDSLEAPELAEDDGPRVKAADEQEKKNTDSDWTDFAGDIGNGAGSVSYLCGRGRGCIAVRLKE